MSHPSTKFVRFILGGNDAGRYPGFNGIFTYVTFGAQKGVFIDTVDQLKSYLVKQDAKVIPVPLVNTPMVDS